MADFLPPLSKCFSNLIQKYYRLNNFFLLFYVLCTYLYLKQNQTSKNIDFFVRRSEKSSSTTSQDDSNNAISSCSSSQSSAAAEQQRPFRFPTLSIDRSAIPCKWEDCGQGFKSHARLSDHIKVLKYFFLQKSKFL